MFGSFVMDAAGSSPAISKMYIVRQIHKYDQFGEIAQIAYITRGLFGGIIFVGKEKGKSVERNKLDGTLYGKGDHL